MPVAPINPKTGRPLVHVGERLEDDTGARFPIVAGVPRFGEVVNYTSSFGLQWTRFAKTQFDREVDGLMLSRRRFLAETRWEPRALAAQEVLEVGSGAGRFSRVVLLDTDASLTSVDYSDAVTANKANNGHIAPDRFRLYQADIYDLPFPDGAFDKVFCFGVLQHTPDFAKSVEALIAKAKPGGEIVVDFYPINGWWTKLHAKYLLRPFTKRVPPAALLRLIDGNLDWLLHVQRILHRIGLGVLARFVPGCGVFGALPATLSPAERREWALLDTYDQYSPAHDHPQRIDAVRRMFEQSGATVTFAGVERFEGGSAAVVRATKAG